MMADEAQGIIDAGAAMVDDVEGFYFEPAPPVPPAPEWD
jgi:hypothetical protein